jgi:predicted ArsR family transcriptional regulator
VGSCTTSRKSSRIDQTLNRQLSLLERRHMQNTIEMLDSLKQRFGPDVAGIVDNVMAESTRREWAGIAHQARSNTLDDLISRLWSPEVRSRGYEFTIERSERGVMVVCTRCPVHDLARELGSTEWVNHLVCKNDRYIVEGFNPKLSFRHIKSLMEGQDCCQQLYSEND